MISLQEAGFDQDNPDHILLVLGDIFDRGEESKKIYSFLRKLPLSRRILVKGNHELLLLDLLKAGYPLSHDISNGTYDTLFQFAYGLAPLEAAKELLWAARDIPYEDKRGRLDEIERIIHRRLFEGKKIKEVASWLESKAWVPYFETPHYVFVHSWVPLAYDEQGCFAYDPFWREKGEREWEEAMWGCPYVHYQNGLWKQEEEKGKTLVCGHWHTSDFYNHLDYLYEPDKRLDIRLSNPIYRSSAFPGLIGLDACTVLTKKVNILVLKEGEL